MFYEINTKKAPLAIGPYVQGVDIGNMIITSGQIPIDPKTGKIDDNIRIQVKQSLDNIRAIVEAAGLHVANIAKTTIFLKNIDDFDIVNNIYTDFFNKYQAKFPARSCIEVARLPKDVKVEIEAIAVR